MPASRLVPRAAGGSCEGSCSIARAFWIPLATARWVQSSLPLICAACSIAHGAARVEECMGGPLGLSLSVHSSACAPRAILESSYWAAVKRPCACLLCLMVGLHEGVQQMTCHQHVHSLSSVILEERWLGSCCMEQCFCQIESTSMHHIKELTGPASACTCILTVAIISQAGNGWQPDQTHSWCLCHIQNASQHKHAGSMAHNDCFQSETTTHSLSGTQVVLPTFARAIARVNEPRKLCPK